MKRLLSFLEHGGIFVVVVLLVIIGRIVSADFLSPDNLMRIIESVALLGIVAVGMAFVTYSGNMADLSLPSIMAFSGIVTVKMLPCGFGWALFAGVVAALAVGAINGLVVGRLKANPILWTLAVAFYMEGFMRYWSKTQVYPDVTPGTSGAAFIRLFRLSAGPIPCTIAIMLALIALGQLVMSYTKFGRESKLVGSARAAAAASGIRVSRVVLINYLVAASAAAVAGILLTSMNKYGVYDLAIGYDFRAVTAVVIGGVMLSGGRGNMVGVLGGVLVMGLLVSIMQFVGINSFRQNIVTGAVFVAIVGLHQYQLRRRGRDYA